MKTEMELVKSLESQLRNDFEHALQTLIDEGTQVGDSDNSGNLFEFLCENDYLFEDLKLRPFSDLDIDDDSELREYYHSLAKDVLSEI